MSEEEVVDLEVARYGLRTFEVKGGLHGGLKSLFQETYWNNGVMEAECRASSFDIIQWRWHNKGEHRVPAKYCGCGIYATVSLQSLIAQYPEQMLDNGVAVVAAEGETIIGDRGMRTSAARIVAYWAPTKKTRRTYRRTCGSEARYFRKMSEMLKAYGFPPCPSFPDVPRQARRIKFWELW